MPRARFLAPWHQLDLIAALEKKKKKGQSESGEALASLAALMGRPAIYHCISRVVDRRFLLGDAERGQFVRYMRTYERFCGVRVLAFCVMSNHFHILVEVPAAPEEHGADWSDERLLEHLAGLYSKQQMEKLRWELEHYREQRNTAAADAFRERYFKRMWDLSQFMKTLKQRFTSWFNRQHERRGTLWEERFKSILVEDGHAARTVAAYIDLNPVRARMVTDPKDYRWCSYGEAVAGMRHSREGLQRVMYEKESTLSGEERAAEMLLSWKKAAARYRRTLYADLQGLEMEQDSARAKRFSEGRALRHRMRHAIDGMAIGRQPFIEHVFGWCRTRFGPRRRNGARKIRHIDTPLRTLRDLREDTGVP